MSEFSFESEIYYSQIALFKYGIDNPFNDWNDTHVNQGFSWREGSVSFSTLSNDGKCKISVKLIDKLEIGDDVERAIVVPFKVDEGGIEVGSVMETIPIDIPKGNYELLFTAKNTGSTEHYTFSFKVSENSIPRVLKADEGLNLPEKLLMEANPAI